MVAPPASVLLLASASIERLNEPGVGEGVGLGVLLGVGVGIGVGVGVGVPEPTPETTIRSKSGAQLPEVGLKNSRVLLLPAFNGTVVAIEPTVFQSLVGGKLSVMGEPPLTLSEAMRLLP